MPGTWRASGREGAGGGARAPAYHGGDAAGRGFFDLLRTDEVDVRINGARCDDHAFAGNHLGGWAYHDADARLDIRIAGFSYARDQAVLDSDVGLDDAGDRIDDQRVGDHAVDAIGAHALALPHSVAYDLAAA